MPDPSQVRVRFAPSPTGPFHIGGARTALYNYLYARATGGTFVLRIDDTDRERSTEESLQNVLASLRWLGLAWDEGPEKGGDYGPYFQSQRLPSYHARVATLLEQGDAYPCFCTPEEVQAGREHMQRETGVGMYDRRCRALDAAERGRRLAAGAAHTVRFAIPTGSLVVDDVIKGAVEVDLAQVDDWVMLREDQSPLYNLCSTIDDIDMQISHVIRGEEHFVNAVKQILLFRALGAEPPRFAHLPLILGTDGKKLSKRKAQTNLLDYRDAGYPPEALVNFFARLGWGFDAERDLFTIEEAIERFELEKVGKSGSIFDEEKMLWMCGVYVRETPLAELLERVTPFLVAAGTATAADIAASRPWFRNVVACFRERIRIYSELPDKIGYFVADTTAGDTYAIEDKARANLTKSAEVPRYLAAWVDSLRATTPPPSRPGRPAVADEEVVLPSNPEAPVEPEGSTRYATPKQLEVAARAVAGALGVGFGQLVHPIRAALTGTTGGPSLFDIVYLLGREQVEARIARVLGGS